MLNTSGLIRFIRPMTDRHPRSLRILRRVDQELGLWRHSAATVLPVVIQPQPRQLTVAVTARCNLRCLGCRYGRDFMQGHQLSLEMVRELFEDAQKAGVNKIRLYGGEPLLHPDLPAMVEHATRLGMQTYITTNGTLLDRRIDDLYAAGLRIITLGFYGIGKDYNEYTQRKAHYEKLEASLDAVRGRYGEQVELQLNFVLLRTTCSVNAVKEAWAFAERYHTYFHIDLASYSLPFFTQGPDQCLAFRPGDRLAVERVTQELIRLKQEYPERFTSSMAFLRSVPDWLLLGPKMHVPCDAYDLIWVGADGTVQLCDTYFRLGNLHQQRLRQILFGAEHRQACRDAFHLQCPNCSCKANARILKDRVSLQRYS